MADATARLRVLIVDDEPLFSWSLAETLVQAGDLVTEARSAVAAVRALATALDPVDVVLLDYQLPDSKNLSLLSTIRRLAPKCAVILMSAYLTPELKKQALELGACHAISKPIDMATVPALVHGAVHSPASDGRGGLLRIDADFSRRPRQS